MTFLRIPGEKIDFSSEDEDERLSNFRSNDRQSSYEGSIDENYDHELSDDEYDKLREYWRTIRPSSSDDEDSLRSCCAKRRSEESEAGLSSCSLPLKLNKSRSKIPRKLQKPRKSKIPQLSRKQKMINANKVAEYDLNGDRDFLCFNISEYKDRKLNRIGAKEDGKLLRETFLKKGFKVRSFMDGVLNKKFIAAELKTYVNTLNNGKRGVKVLIIAFMAHGAQDDKIVFSDETTCRYKLLLQPIFDCEKLQGVPKIIINQFCRGKFNMNTAFLDHGPEENVSCSRLINGQADLLQCFSTVEGNQAVRQNNGSPFIYELCSFMKERLSSTASDD